MKPINQPTEDALSTSIKNAVWFYNVFLVLWIGSAAWFAYSHDSYWLIYSLFFFVGAVAYFLAQKIDKARLENLRK